MPKPKAVAMPKVSIRSDEMVKALRHVDFVPLLDGKDDFESSEDNSIRKAEAMLGVDKHHVVMCPMFGDL